jgi:hypothetical protein
MLKRTSVTGEFTTKTEIRGPLDEVLEAIKSELVNYDPRGYGTSVDSLHFAAHSDTEYVARMSRMNSCD